MPQIHTFTHIFTVSQTKYKLKINHYHLQFALDENSWCKVINVKVFFIFLFLKIQWPFYLVWNKIVFSMQSTIEVECNDFIFGIFISKHNNGIWIHHENNDQFHWCRYLPVVFHLVLSHSNTRYVRKCDELTMESNRNEEKVGDNSYILNRFCDLKVLSQLLIRLNDSTDDVHKQILSVHFGGIELSKCRGPWAVVELLEMLTYHNFDIYLIMNQASYTHHINYIPTSSSASHLFNNQFYCRFVFLFFVYFLFTCNNTFSFVCCFIYFFFVHKKAEKFNNLRTKYKCCIQSCWRKST